MNTEPTTLVASASDHLAEDAPAYTTPALADLGSVPAVTLGSNRNDRADDTEYYS